MSEAVNMQILIGGKIKTSNIKDLSSAIYTDCCEGSVVINEEECVITKIKDKLVSKSTPLIVQCPVSYGNCINIKTFCRKHKLSYKCSSEAYGDCEALVCSWAPKSGEERESYATQSGKALIKVDEIMPYINFMYDAICGDTESISNNVEYTKLNFCKKHKKSGGSPIDLLKIDLDKLLWKEPIIPPFEVI